MQLNCQILESIPLRGADSRVIGVDQLANLRVYPIALEESTSVASLDSSDGFHDPTNLVVTFRTLGANFHLLGFFHHVARDMMDGSLKKIQLNQGVIAWVSFLKFMKFQGHPLGPPLIPHDLLIQGPNLIPFLRSTPVENNRSVVGEVFFPVKTRTAKLRIQLIHHPIWSEPLQSHGWP